MRPDRDPPTDPDAAAAEAGREKAEELRGPGAEVVVPNLTRAEAAADSAGAAVTSDSVITGSQYRPGVDTVGYYGDEYPRIARHFIELRPGSGFLPGAIVDPHFFRRERHNRLLSTTLEHPSLLGVGIDESTALQVNPDGRWEVRGASAVIVYDARPARVTPARAPARPGSPSSSRRRGTSSGCGGSS